MGHAGPAVLEPAWLPVYQRLGFVATGPEVQLEDNAKASDPERCGWLYGLYKPEMDPKTGKPLDATKPAGEWNHLLILVSP